MSRTICMMDTFIASQWIDGVYQVVSIMTLCKHCGFNASEEAIYCIMCGKKLNVTEESHGGVKINLKNLLRGHNSDEEITV
jgi:hypothetical protein